MPDGLITAAVAGLCSSIGTVAALRTEMRNLRERIDRMQHWITKIETRAEDTREHLLTQRNRRYDD